MGAARTRMALRTERNLKDNPLVSVVTPSYNSAAYIGATLESIQIQDYPAIEHIVIDGGSTDGTLEILARYPQLVWTSEPDKGQSDALNKGFRRAQGEIIGWLNADDTYQPGAISTAVTYFLAHPQTMAVYSECRVIDEAGHFLHFYGTEDFDLRTLLLHDYIPQPTVFFRREVLDTVGLLNEKLHYVMDWEYWLRIGRYYPMTRLPDVTLANLRVWDACKSIAHAPKFDLEYLEVLASLLTVSPYREMPRSLHRRAARLARSRHFMASAFAAHNAAARRQTLSALTRGVWYNPRWLFNLGIWSIGGEAVLGKTWAAALRRAARWVMRRQRLDG